MFEPMSITDNILNSWGVSKDDLRTLCRRGFRELIIQNFSLYTDVDLNELRQELQKLAPLESSHAWIYRTILAASLEVPHIRNLCMPQADGESFINKLRSIGNTAEDRFVAALKSLIGSATPIIIQTMSSDTCPFDDDSRAAHRIIRQEYQNLMQTLGCEENFSLLAEIVCTANPRTNYGADRYLLEQQAAVLRQMESTYSLGTMDGQTYMEAMQKMHGYYACKGVDECHKLREQLKRDFQKKYLNNDVLGWRHNGKLCLVNYPLLDARYHDPFTV